MMLNSKRNTGSQQAPVPPQRNTSTRASAPLTPPTHMAHAMHNFGSSGGLSVGAAGGAGACPAPFRVVIDLEAKFGKRFHNVTEFSKPPPFLNIQKIYPSRALQASNGATVVPGNNNNISAACNNNEKTAPLAPKPANAPTKKYRAPAPPPQAGVAAATVSVIRHSSFLYGGNGTAGVSGGTVRP